MWQAEEQIVDVVKEEQNEIVELSQADLQWVGGGLAEVTTAY
jgi:hypothetical protein